MTTCKISYRDVAIAAGSGNVCSVAAFTETPNYHRTLRAPRLVQPRIYDPFSR